MASSHASNVGLARVAFGPARLEDRRLRERGIAHLLDPDRVTAPGDQELGCSGELLLARARDLRERRPAVRRGGGVGRHLGEHLRDGPGRDERRAHPRHVAHGALPAPLDELRDELVELRGAQDERRDRGRQRGLLVRHHGSAIASGEAVGSDYGHNHHAQHACLRAGLVQVARRGREELRGRRLVGRRRGGRVDDALHVLESLREALPGDHVRALRARDRHDVPAGLQHLDDVTAHAPGCSGDGDLLGRLHDKEARVRTRVLLAPGHRCLSPCWVRTLGQGSDLPAVAHPFDPSPEVCPRDARSRAAAWSLRSRSPAGTAAGHRGRARA